MLSLKRPAMVAILAASLAAAQPALTTIQDTLYRADGTRFTGTVYITYSSFLAGDTSNIATNNLTLPVVNGAFRVRLVPTTTASAGAQYNVRYNSRGINDFVETWAVPPSTVSLRIRDVRIRQGVIVGPPPVLSPVQLPDVVGLQNELAIRPQKGIGFGIGRAAMINQAGQIDAVGGNLGDCVRVDGSAGACGSGGGGVYPTFADAEVPAGSVNGTNPGFTLVNAPSPVTSLALFRNGVLQRLNVDYTLSGAAITFFGGAIPVTGDLLQAYYRWADPLNPLGSFASPQVICSAGGTSVSTIVSTQLGSCTIPASVLQAGDRLAIEFNFGHTGNASGFNADVRFGGVQLLFRTLAGSESLLTGRASIGTFTTGQIWNVESLGTMAAPEFAAGQSAEDITQAITIAFRAQLTAGSADSISLRNFTVIRYPSQANP